MKKPRPFIIVLAVLTVLLWAWDYGLKPQSPPLIELLSQVGVGASLREQESAIGFLASQEPYPASQLVRILTAPHESRLRAKWIDFVRQHGLHSMRRRAWHAEELRDKAANILIAVGKRKGRVGADLSAALADSRPRVRYLATRALAEVGSESKDIPTLIDLVRDADPGVSDAALIALAKSGAKARSATTTLLGVVGATLQPFGTNAWPYGWSHRSNACIALARVAVMSESVSRVLSVAATDSDARVRQAVQEAIATMTASSESSEASK